MSIVLTDDPLTLQTIKKHLNVDFNDDDTLIQTYSLSSLHYVQNYCGKVFATWGMSEVFESFDNPIFLEYEFEVRTADITYPTDLVGGTNTVTVQVYANNAIRESEPLDYVGGAIEISYVPYLNPMQLEIANQIRLLFIGDCYTHREDTITGTIVQDLPNGVIRMMDTIKTGRV